MRLSNEDKAAVESLGDFVEAARKYANAAEEYMMQARNYCEQAQILYAEAINTIQATKEMQRDTEMLRDETKNCVEKLVERFGMQKK